MAPIGSSELIVNIEQAFFVLASTTVLFMQAGFGFLEAGSVRPKNTTTILSKNLLNSFIGCVAYWAVGFALAFGSGNSFIGTNHFFLSAVDNEQTVTFLIQFTVAITATTIVSGAMAERTEFVSYLFFSFFCTAWLQPVVAHWAWAKEGWLYSGVDVDLHHMNITVRYKDFAGSSVVHVVGGAAAFMGAAAVGPRIGRFDNEGKPVAIAAPSTTMATLGGFILIYGFLAFNLASHGSLSQPGDGAMLANIAINTILAGSGGSLTALVHERILERKKPHVWSLITALNGCLTGMVAVGAGANTLRPYGGFVVGCVAGCVYVVVVRLVERARVDDAVGAVAVHFGGGTWGVISVTFLDTEQGLFYVGNRVSMILIGWNLCGLVVITVWTVLFSGAVFGILYCLKFLRVPPEVEKKGLDFSRNGGARANALDRQWRKAPSKSTSSTPPPSSTASRQDIGVTRDYSVTSLVQLQTGRTVVLANHARCPEAKTVLAESDEDGRSSPVVTGDGCGDDPISAV